MPAHEQRNLKQIAYEVFGDTKRESTIRVWTKKYGIPSELTDKERLFDAKLIAVFKQIKALKAERPRFSEATIDANVLQALEEMGAQRDCAPPLFEPLRNETHSDVAAQSIAQEHNETLMAALKETVQASTKTAEKYAQAMREVGNLEALLRVTQEQLTEAKKQLLMLPETTQALEKAQSEAEALRAQIERERAAHDSANAALRHEIETLRAPAPEPANGSWWQRLWTK